MLLHYCNETWYAIYFDVSDVLLNVVKRDVTDANVVNEC